MSARRDSRRRPAAGPERPGPERLGPAAHWRGNVRLTAALLLLWAVVTFGGVYYARVLNFSFFGWPFSFFLGAQGAPVLYLLIVCAYAWAMGRADRRHGVGDDDRDGGRGSGGA
ncbi:MAG: DUF4212 domain-containing protein [Burkholderiaceae bacterium]